MEKMVFFVLSAQALCSGRVLSAQAEAKLAFLQVILFAILSTICPLNNWQIQDFSLGEC